MPSSPPSWSKDLPAPSPQRPSNLLRTPSPTRSLSRHSPLQHSGLVSPPAFTLDTSRAERFKQIDLSDPSQLADLAAQPSLDLLCASYSRDLATPIREAAYAEVCNRFGRNDGPLDITGNASPLDPTPAPSSSQGAMKVVNKQPVSSTTSPHYVSIEILRDDVEAGDQNDGDPRGDRIDIAIDQASVRILPSPSVAVHVTQTPASYAAILAHPLFKPVIDRLDSALEQLVGANLHLPLQTILDTTLHINWRAAGSDFKSDLEKALEGSAKVYAGRPPITLGLDLEEIGSEDFFQSGMGSVVWQPFFREHCERRIKEFYSQRTTHATTAATTRPVFLFRPEETGMNKISHSTDRSSGSDFALSDGHHLAAMGAIFSAISIRTPSIPPAHFFEGMKETIYEIFPARAPDAEQIDKILIATLEGPIDEVEKFDSRMADIPTFRRTPAHMPFTRPVSDEYGLPRETGFLGTAVEAKQVASPDDFFTCGGKGSVLGQGVDLNTIQGVDLNTIHSPDISLRLLHPLKPSSEPSLVGSPPESATRRPSFRGFLPSRPFEVIASHKEQVHNEVIEILGSVDRTNEFLEVRKLVLAGADGLSSSGGAFGFNFNVRNGVDAVFVFRDLLQEAEDEELLTPGQADKIWTMAITAITLAVMSIRPAAYSLVMAANLAILELAVCDDLERDRIRSFFSQLNQRYTCAFISFVAHSDYHRCGSVTDPLAVKRFSAVVDLICRNGVCQTCGKALCATGVDLPSNRSSDNDRLLSTTTLNCACAPMEERHPKAEIEVLFGDKLPAKAMMSCLVELQSLQLSLPARVTDKTVAGLTHYSCKTQRRRRLLAERLSTII